MVVLRFEGLLSDPIVPAGRGEVLELPALQRG